VTSPAGIGVCFGDGDGTFQSPVLYQAGGDSLLGYPVVGDFNGDGIPDVALPADSGIWLFTGEGGGVFNPGVLIPVTPYSATATAGMAAADARNLCHIVATLGRQRRPQPGMRNQSLPDILAAQSSAVAVLLNEGQGKFVDGEYPPLPNSGNCGAATDFNGDGKPDLAVPTA
jgi:hypothetical protein